MLLKHPIISNKGKQFRPIELYDLTTRTPPSPRGKSKLALKQRPSFAVEAPNSLDMVPLLTSTDYNGLSTVRSLRAKITPRPSRCP